MKFTGLPRTVAAVLLALGLVLAFSGCAVVNQARMSPGQKLDPWENWNRKVFAFNEGLDAAVLKPVATAYSAVVPSMVRTGVSNFFGNFSDAWSAVNNLLQGKLEKALSDVFRVGTNTTFGLLGLLDVAGEMGLERQSEDLGQTLGHWGVGAGAYIVWPLLGPSTVRESFALPFDRAWSPAFATSNSKESLAITLEQLINTRAGLLAAGNLLDDIALDKYTFLRDAYLQRRRSLVYDGEEKELEDPEAPASAASAAAKPAAPSASAPAK